MIKLCIKQQMSVVKTAFGVKIKQNLSLIFLVFIIIILFGCRNDNIKKYSNIGTFESIGKSVDFLSKKLKQYGLMFEYGKQTKCKEYLDILEIIKENEKYQFGENEYVNVEDIYSKMTYSYTWAEVMKRTKSNILIGFGLTEYEWVEDYTKYIIKDYIIFPL